MAKRVFDLLRWERRLLGRLDAGPIRVFFLPLRTISAMLELVSLSHQSR